MPNYLLVLGPTCYVGDRARIPYALPSDHRRRIVDCPFLVGGDLLSRISAFVQPVYQGQCGVNKHSL